MGFTKKCGLYYSRIYSHMVTFLKFAAANLNIPRFFTLGRLFINAQPIACFYFAVENLFNRLTFQNISLFYGINNIRFYVNQIDFYSKQSDTIKNISLTISKVLKTDYTKNEYLLNYRIYFLIKSFRNKIYDVSTI